jgi:hypothetical protein
MSRFKFQSAALKITGNLPLANMSSLSREAILLDVSIPMVGSLGRSGSGDGVGTAISAAPRCE